MSREEESHSKKQTIYSTFPETWTTLLSFDPHYSFPYRLYYALDSLSDPCTLSITPLFPSLCISFFDYFERNSCWSKDDDTERFFLPDFGFDFFSIAF